MYPAAGNRSAKRKSPSDPVVRSVLRSRTHSPQNRRLARDLVWSWVGSKWPRLMPSASELERSHIDYSLPGRKLRVTTSEDGSAWKLELSWLDRESARTWITQAVVADAGDADLLAVETACSPAPAPSVAPPRVLAAWVERLEVEDGGVPVLGEPRLVQTAEQIESFFAHLLLAQRALPLVVLANKPNSRYYGADPRGLAEAARGLAHVACLSPEAVAAFAARFGRRLSPVQGAVRVYMPGFAAQDEANEHVLIDPGASAADARAGEPTGPGAFRRLLCQRLCELSVRPSRAPAVF